jgi:hypothetical protein
MNTTDHSKEPLETDGISDEEMRQLTGGNAQKFKVKDAFLNWFRIANKDPLNLK